jgi:hypothetical protein
MAKRNLSKELAARAAFFKKLNLKKLDDASRWQDVAQRSLAAHRALQLNALVDGPTQRAFDAFALSDGNPDHWRKLLDIFAELHYGKPQKRGPKEPSRWTKERKQRLAADFVKTIQDMRRKRIEIPQSLQVVAEHMKSEDEARPKGKGSYTDTTARQMYQQLRSFFSRDENSDPQFLSWIAERLG